MPPSPLQRVACSAVLGFKPHLPWRVITLALGSAQSGASPGAWHAIVHCCKRKHTYTESIPSAVVPDGWQTGMLAGPNHLLQLGDRVPQRGEGAGRDWDLLHLFCCSARINCHRSFKQAKFWIVTTVVFVLECLCIALLFLVRISLFLAACYAPSDNG